MTVDVPVLLSIWLVAAIPLGVAVGWVIRDSRRDDPVVDPAHHELMRALRDLCDHVDVPDRDEVLR